MTLGQMIRDVNDRVNPPPPVVWRHSRSEQEAILHNEWTGLTYRMPIVPRNGFAYIYFDHYTSRALFSDQYRGDEEAVPKMLQDFFDFSGGKVITLYEDRELDAIAIRGILRADLPFEVEFEEVRDVPGLPAAQKLLGEASI